jgi:glycosyltransferase involved in cell wall biosynthesis
MIEALLLCEYPSLNGGERSMLALVEAMHRGGVNVTFAAPSHGPLSDELRRREIEHIAWDVFDADGKRKSLESIREELQQILTRKKPNILHANSLSTARISGPVASKLGMPRLGHLRDIIKLNRTAIEDINCHDRLLAVSKATRDWHVRQGLAADKTFVMYNGVDTEQFKPRSSTGCLHDELGLPTEAVIALSVGQIGLRKGIDITFEGLRRVVGEFANLHLVVVGERNSTKDEAVEFERQLEQVAEETSLRGRVHFLGRRIDVADLLNEATFLIHAARQEPLGRVLLEAAACGVPTIASKVGGTEEIFPIKTQSALLVPPDDPIVIAEAIRQILTSHPLRDRLALAARQRATQHFNVETAAQSLLEHYRAVASSST